MSKLESVKKIFLFRGASESDLQTIAELSQIEEVLAGDYLYRSGEKADAFYFIERGSVDLVKSGASAPVATLGGDQSLGVAPFFDNEIRAANAQAKEATQVLKIPFEGLKRLMEQRPEFALTVYRNETAFLVKTLRNISDEMRFRYF